MVTIEAAEAELSTLKLQNTGYYVSHDAVIFSSGQI